MPLPMVHLAVAVALQPTPSPDYLLGSIAPDAIHTRPNAVRADKLFTHLSETDESRPLERIQALAAFPDAQREFRLGYAIHLLTDRIWLATMDPLFQRRLAQPLSPAEKRSLYYRETDQIDFDLFRQSPWRPHVWQLLARSRAVDFPPYLTAQEIHRWNQRTLDWFFDLSHEPGITPTHITRPQVEEFIASATVEIQAQLLAWCISVKD